MFNLFVSGYLVNGGGSEALAEFIKLSTIKNVIIISANVDKSYFRMKFGSQLTLIDIGEILDGWPSIFRWIGLWVRVFRQERICKIFTNDIRSLLIVSAIPFLPCKIIHFLHEDINSYNSKIQKKLIIFSLNRCKAIIANSKYTEKTLKQFISKDVEIDLLYQPLEAETTEVSDDVRFVMATRIARDKNIMLILRAFNSLKIEHDLTPILDIYGCPNTEDDFKYMSHLSYFVNCSGLDNVKLRGWESDSNSIYKNHSHYISASARESFGRATVEALIRGLIPIVSNIPSHQEFVNDASGHLFDPDNEKELTDLLLKIITRKCNKNESSPRDEMLEVFSKNTFSIKSRRIIDY